MSERVEKITSSKIREALFYETLIRLKMLVEYGLDDKVLRDSFQSMLFLGPPGVGKTVLQYMSAKDVASYLSEIRRKNIQLTRVKMMIPVDEAKDITEKVVAGNVIPYLHLYLPQVKIWNLEGTPSPMDNFVEVMGQKIPVNLWRIDAFFLPFLDYTNTLLKSKTPEEVAKTVVPKFVVLDEVDKARKDVLEALYNLARSGELSHVNLCPLTLVSMVGNTPETDIYGVRELSAPLVDRTQVYIVEKPDVSGWLSFMNEFYRDKWASEVGAFLSINPNQIYVQDPSKPNVIQTPRGFTQVAVKLYVLKTMLNNKEIDLKTYFEQAKRIIDSTLIKETADELFAFIKGLRFVNINEVIKNPETIKTLDKNVAAYVLVRATTLLSKDYAFKPKEEKDRIVKTLVELVNNGTSVLGNETLGLVISSLPIPLRLSLAKHLDKNIHKTASEARKLADELEEMLNTA